MHLPAWRAAWQRLAGRGASRLIFGAVLGVVLPIGAWWGQVPPRSVDTPESPWEKYLVPEASEPTFRFPVAHEHGLGSWARFCSGFLVISRAELRYEVLRPAENRDHSFQVSRAAIVEAGQWRGLGPAATAELKFGGRVYHFYLVPPKVLDKDPHTLLGENDVLPWPPVTQIVMRFDDVVAQIQRRRAAPEKKEEAKAAPGPAAPAPEKPAEVLGPKVRIMEPAVTDSTTPVEVAQPVIALRGVALDPKGVLSIRVNDRQAELKAVGDITAMEFSVEDLKLRPGLNRVTVTATNTDHKTTQLPVLLWLRSTGVPAPAAPRTSAEKVTPPPEERPLTQAQVLELLQNDVPSERIASFVERYGIDFELSDEFVARLRKLGAQDLLVEALRKARRLKPSSTP